MGVCRVQLSGVRPGGTVSGKKNGRRYIVNKIWTKFILKVVLKIGFKNVLKNVPQTCPERLIISRDLSWECPVTWSEARRDSGRKKMEKDNKQKDNRMSRKAL